MTWRAGPNAFGDRPPVFGWLGVLTPPDPMPPGSARPADIGDQDLLVDWTVAFSQETGAGDPGRAARAVADRLSHDGLMLRETGGVPVAMAGVTREVAGVVGAPSETS